MASPGKIFDGYHNPNSNPSYFIISQYTEKKREPTWLSWRVILKIGSLLWRRAVFFFIIMFGTKIELQREQSYGQPDRRANLALLFFSVYLFNIYLYLREAAHVIGM